MDFETLLKQPERLEFGEDAVVWEFTLYKIKKTELCRQGDTGHYAHNDEGCNRIFRFDDFDQFREAYIVAHEENIRRLRERESPIMDIGPMRNYSGSPCGKDSCG